MNLHRVAKGKVLHLPNGYPSLILLGGRDRLWLKEGGIVDLDDPFIAEACKGQEYKLEPDPKAKQADPIPHAGLLRQRDQFLAKVAGKPAPPTKSEKLVAVGAGEVGEVQTPDARPQRASAKA